MEEDEELSLMAVLELIRNLNADSTCTFTPYYILMNPILAIRIKFLYLSFIDFGPTGTDDGPRQALYRLNGIASSPGAYFMSLFLVSYHHLVVKELQ